ncbi:MAG: hypothetical protein EU533_00830 [Promethearchaeota archaeon]|nr:MAG: hypothetical protein EU533_00830 [Candidatus Lokiarchaeota archaeon]
MIVFSHNPAEKKSFDDVIEWHEDIKKYCGNIPTMLFGNKIDLVDLENLEDEKANQLADERSFLGYYLTSAKTGNGVYEAFQAIIRNLYEKYKDQ